MNTEQYKQTLEQEKETILANMKNIGAYNNPTTGTWDVAPTPAESGEADSNENADRFEDFEEKSSEVKILEKRLNDISAALAKMDIGTYGICEVCQMPIESARLDANPAARTCLTHINE